MACHVAECGLLSGFIAPQRYHRAPSCMAPRTGNVSVLPYSHNPIYLIESWKQNTGAYTIPENIAKGVCWMNQKRVYCLYRVSTVGQVEQDDIPMQRQYCREFIEQNPEWVLANELYEKGISGFKVKVHPYTIIVSYITKYCKFLVCFAVNASQLGTHYFLSPRTLKIE